MEQLTRISVKALSCKVILFFFLNETYRVYMVKKWEVSPLATLRMTAQDDSGKLALRLRSGCQLGIV